MQHKDYKKNENIMTMMMRNIKLSCSERKYNFLEEVLGDNIM